MFRNKSYDISMASAVFSPKPSPQGINTLYPKHDFANNTYAGLINMLDVYFRTHRAKFHRVKSTQYLREEKSKE